jgi:DnaJ-class molecular chaperone
MFISCAADDLYSILSVPATASQAEIKAAYRRLVQDLHPDKHAHKQGQVGSS